MNNAFPCEEMKLRLLFAAAAASAVAFAAPVSANEAEKTGFYATLSAGVGFPQDTDSKARILNTDLTGRYSHSAGFQGDIGAGYDFGLIRTELTYSALFTNTNNLKVCATSCVDINTDVNEQVHAGLISAYVDIPTDSKITPYIGGGVGFASIKSGAGTATIGGTRYAIPGGTQDVFAYQAKIGASYELSSATDLFVEGTYKGTENYSVGVEQIDGLGAFGVNLGARFRF